MPASTVFTRRPTTCVALVCILRVLVTVANAADAAHTVVLLCGCRTELVMQRCTETRPGVAVPVPVAVPVACGLLDAPWHAMNADSRTKLRLQNLEPSNINI